MKHQFEFQLQFDLQLTQGLRIICNSIQFSFNKSISLYILNCGKQHFLSNFQLFHPLLDRELRNHKMGTKNISATTVLLSSWNEFIIWLYIGKPKRRMKINPHSFHSHSIFYFTLIHNSWWTSSFIQTTQFTFIKNIVILLKMKRINDHSIYGL